MQWLLRKIYYVKDVKQALIVIVQQDFKWRELFETHQK